LARGQQFWYQVSGVLADLAVNTQKFNFNLQLDVPRRMAAEIVPKVLSDEFTCRLWKLTQLKALMNSADPQLHSLGDSEETRHGEVYTVASQALYVTDARRAHRSCGAAVSRDGIPADSGV